MLVIAQSISDTVRVLMPSSAPFSWGIALTALGLSLTIAGVIYKTGVMRGEHSAFERKTDERLQKLESAFANDITRGELDARFQLLTDGIHNLKDMVRDIKVSHKPL